MAHMTPEQNLIENIEWFSRSRLVGQEELSRRMRLEGFGWHRKTVNRVLHGKRHVKVDELVGLAVALETTPIMLLLPAGPPDEMNFDVRYEIGFLESVGQSEYVNLITEEHDREGRPSVGIEAFPEGEPQDVLPRWRSTKTWLNRLLDLAVPKYAASHPGVDPSNVSARELLTFLEHEYSHETENGD